MERLSLSSDPLVPENPSSARVDVCRRVSRVTLCDMSLLMSWDLSTMIQRVIEAAYSLYQSKFYVG